jgi:hypothetical protein
LGFIWGREVEIFPRRKMETSNADSPPISPPMVDIVVEDEPMVIIHPGVFEDIDVKPSIPLPPAINTINSDANPTIRKAFLLVKIGCGTSFFVHLITFGSVLRIGIQNFWPDPIRNRN